MKTKNSKLKILKLVQYFKQNKNCANIIEKNKIKNYWITKYTQFKQKINLHVFQLN